jgi:hypothetical protein
MPHFWQLPTKPILKIQSFPSGKVIIVKNLSNFVSPTWKLNNTYFSKVIDYKYYKHRKAALQLSHGQVSFGWLDNAYSGAIWMSHWRHTMEDDAKFWIGCHWLAFLSSFGRWQLIQNLAPSTILLRQCDIGIVTVHCTQYISYALSQHNFSVHTT